MSLQTPLVSCHRSLGAKLVDFAGWEMPVQYASLTEEHKAVREQAGIFDVSHMGRFYLTGFGAAEALDRLVVTRLTDMQPGQVRYSVVCNPTGGCMDDILVSCLASDRFFLVVNASNREKLWAWFNEHLSGVSLQDDTLLTGMIAIQGPDSVAIVNALLAVDVSGLAYYHIQECGDLLVSRTGYTGEDGFEIIASAERIVTLWEQALALGAKPAGLGARDLLRLEMGFSLYGHELGEEITPLQAGLAWVVDLSKDCFIGKEALAQEKAEGLSRRRIAFTMEGAGIPRQDCLLYEGDEVIGQVTSGTFSPLLKKGIGLGLVRRKPEHLFVEIRGKKTKAVLAKLPFVPKRVKK